jgi:hypothetical protein
MTEIHYIAVCNPVEQNESSSIQSSLITHAEDVSTMSLHSPAKERIMFKPRVIAYVHFTASAVRFLLHKNQFRAVDACGRLIYAMLESNR